MVIIHKIDDFLFNLFPSIKTEDEEGRKYSAFQVIDPFLDTGMNFKKEYEMAREMKKKDQHPS